MSAAPSSFARRPLDRAPGLLVPVLALGLALVSTACREPAPSDAKRPDGAPLAGPVDWVKWRMENDAEARSGDMSFLAAQDAAYLAEGATGYLPDEPSVLDVRWKVLTGRPERTLLEVRHDGEAAWVTLTDGRAFDLIASGPWRLENGLLLAASMQKDGTLRVTLFNPSHPRLAEFEGFRFFPYDPEAVVKARFRKADEVVRTDYTTTRDLQSHAFLLGHASFQYEGKPVELGAYVFDRTYDPNKPVTYLAFMFKDGTSGKETYGGGRYLDVELHDGLPKDVIELDFNRAQNFYCARSPLWNCPVLWEPALPVAIRAGEMSPLAAHH